MGIFDRFKKVKKINEDSKFEYPLSPTTNVTFLPASTESSTSVSGSFDPSSGKTSFGVSRKKKVVYYPPLITENGNVRSFQASERDELLDEIQKILPPTAGASAEEVYKQFQNFIKKTNPTESGL
jgi:hypothetical protein